MLSLKPCAPSDGTLLALAVGNLSVPACDEPSIVIVPCDHRPPFHTSRESVLSVGYGLQSLNLKGFERNIVLPLPALQRASALALPR
ncbi:MAG: hypothetical protein QOJ58_4745, partial [Alphaproteobacteria bacterium]|nr:hypothetical protein [Alphaproteobacteria bacterium]